MEFTPPKTTAYDQRRVMREREKPQEDPMARIAALEKEVAGLKAWIANFRISGSFVSGNGPVWAIKDPGVIITGSGTVACNEDGSASVTLDLQGKLQ